MRETDIPDGFEVVSVPLAGVRYLEDTVRCKDYGEGRVTEFYDAEPDQFVKAYADGEVVWAPVSGFSIHRGIKVVIIDLLNGCQIVTDHDPRAVFGVLPGEDEPGRFYPDDAFSRKVLVPCQIPSGLNIWGADILSEEFSSLWKALDRKAELLKDWRLGSRVSWDYRERMWMVRSHDLRDYGCMPPHPRLSGIQWTGIESVTYTCQQETGYDITVPGYETFMSIDGIILSNTMNTHVPATREAVQEAVEKLMPSRMPFSIRDQDRIVPALKHEQVLGLYDAQTSPAKRMHSFSSEQEALHAIRSGAVDMADEINIQPPKP